MTKISFCLNCSLFRCFRPKKIQKMCEKSIDSFSRSFVYPAEFCTDNISHSFPLHTLFSVYLVYTTNRRVSRGFYNFWQSSTHRQFSIVFLIVKSSTHYLKISVRHFQKLLPFFSAHWVLLVFFV